MDGLALFGESGKILDEITRSRTESARLSRRADSLCYAYVRKLVSECTGLKGSWLSVPVEGDGYEVVYHVVAVQLKRCFPWQSPSDENIRTDMVELWHDGWARLDEGGYVGEMHERTVCAFVDVSELRYAHVVPSEEIQRWITGIPVENI